MAQLSQWVNAEDVRHLNRIQYLLENRQICAERFYYPLLQRVLSAFADSSLTLAFDTRLLWNQYCLNEITRRVFPANGEGMFEPLKG